MGVQVPRPPVVVPSVACVDGEKDGTCGSTIPCWPSLTLVSVEIHHGTSGIGPWDHGWMSDPVEKRHAMVNRGSRTGLAISQDAPSKAFVSGVGIHKS